MSDDPMMVAVAAGVLSADDAHRALLNSVAETARAIFGAKAASIFLFDERTDELVFEAVAGSGADTLIGRRLPSSAGIAGWVLVTRQPLVIEDVRADPRFAQDVAEDTGYVPKGIMAVPLLHQERSLGVLEVLDRPANAAFTLAEMDLLGLFANQAAIALDLTQRSRRASEALEGADPAYAAVAHVARRLDELGADSAAVRRLLEALADVLGPAGGDAESAGERPDAPPAPPLIRRERRTGPCKRGPGRWPGPLQQECLHAVAVSLDVGLGRIRALVAGVLMAMAMPMRLDVRLRRLLGVVVLALIRCVAMAVSFDVVLGRVFVLRLAMVLVLRHSGSSCLLGEHEKLYT